MADDVKTYCLGLFNNASVFYILKRELENQGHKVITVSYAKNYSKNIKKMEYDYFIRKNIKHPIKFINIFLILLYEFKCIYTFFKVIRRTDVFVFYWRSFFIFNLDLKLIKLLKKQIVWCFCGDDARWYNAMKQEYEANGLLPVKYPSSYDYSNLGLFKRLSIIRMAERYADVIFSRREQAQLQIRPFHHYIPFHQDLEHPVNSVTVKQVKRPLVIHAPTNSEMKGSKYILKAVEELKQENEVDFEFQIIQGMNRSELQKLLEQSNIAIDQLYTPGGGRFTTESLSKGLVVITLMAYNKYPQGFPRGDCPIIDAEVSNIKSVLKATIQDLELREKKSKQGVDYVNEVCLAKYFVQTLTDLVDGSEIEYDYKPHFFVNDYVPKGRGEVLLQNIYLRILKKQNWYKRIPKPKTRLGLKF